MSTGRSRGIAAVAAGVLLALPASAAAHRGEVANPGFEAGAVAGAPPAGWRTAGAAATAEGGHTGAYALAHASSGRAAATWQRVRLPRGWNTLRAWVRTGTQPEPGSIALHGCGRRDRRTVLPPTDGEWLRLVVSADVRGRGCTILLHTRAGGGGASFDDVEVVRGRPELPIRGADVSSLDKSEDLGGVYRDARGRRGDALRILRSAGMNWIRLRAWVDPADGYHDTAELLRMARRAKAAGLRVLVDVHYSDFWADPGKQWTPAAWAGRPYAEVRRALGDYTGGLVRALVAQGTPPDMIQLGNEINSGLVWDYAATWTGCSTADDGAGGERTECHTEDWAHVADLLTEGYRAVKAASPRTQVMLHLAEGGDKEAFRWWFDNVTARNVPFDVIGASFYGYYHGTLSELQANLDEVAEAYGKPIVVAETAYPFTLADADGLPNIIDLESELVPGYPATPAGQSAWLRDLQSVVRTVPGGLGLGSFWWEATWTAVPGNGWSPRDPASGNGWENQALFGYDGRLLPAAWEFKR